ncbi:hypothetical protein [Minisyncoccus archaeiphilus]
MDITEQEKYISDLLLKKEFSIKDTGLTYRVINNWSVNQEREGFN